MNFESAILEVLTVFQCLDIDFPRGATLPQQRVKPKRLTVHHLCCADGRMLQVQKDLSSWCSKHSLQLADLDAYSKLLGFGPSEVQKHCAKIEMVRLNPLLENQHIYCMPLIFCSTK